MNRANRLAYPIAMLVYFIAGCADLAVVKVWNGTEYVFEGAKSIKERADGRWLLQWEGAPQAAEYEIFSREVPLSEQQGSGNSSSAVVTPAYNFSAPVVKVTTNFYVTENLLLKNNTCFVVRLVFPGYSDSNTKEVCTGHTAATGAVVGGVTAKFESLDLINGAADGVLNAADIAADVEIVSLKASSFSEARYAIVESATECGNAQTYSSLVPKTSSGFLDGRLQKVCVRLKGSSAQAVYGSSAAVSVDLSAPVFALLALQSPVADGFLNAGDASATTPIAALTATGHVSSSYALVSPSTTCNSDVSYNRVQIPSVNDSGLTDGNVFKLCVKLRDAAGNVSFGASSANLFVDKSPPSITLSSPSVVTIAASQTTSFTVNYADTASGVSSIALNNANASTYVSLTGAIAGDAAGCLVTVSGTGTSSRIIAISGCSAAAGRVSLSLSAGTAVDSGGNSSAAVGPSAEFMVDNTAPVLTITSPAANTPRFDAVTLAGACEAGLAVVASVVDGGSTASSICTVGNTYSLVLSLTGSDGKRTIVVSTTDAASETSLRALSVIKDTTPPAATISSPSIAHIKQSSSATYSLAFSDANGVTTTDSNKISLSPSAGVSSCIQSVSGVGSEADPFIMTVSGCAGNGTVGISVSPGAATDAVGNTSLAATSAIAVNVDNTAPTPSISSPAVNAVLNSTSVSIPLQGSCENGLTVALEGDVAGGQTTNCTAGSFSFPSWTLVAGDGTKAVSISQTDAAGNKGTSSRNFILDTTPVPGAAGVVFVATQPVHSLHATLTGSCDSSGNYTTTASSTHGTVDSVVCAAGALTIQLSQLPEGRNTVSVTALVTRNANGTTRSATTSFVQSFFCPKGYVAVPGKAVTDLDVNGLGLYGDGTTSDTTGYARAGRSDGGLDPTRDFCVMKYEAKVATSNSGGQTPWEPVYDGNKDFITGSPPAIAENYWPESRADGSPWVNITRDEAIDRCNALNEAAGFCSGSGCYSTFDNSQWGYRLISNTQWQVMARNLEKTGANWTSGTAGSGYLWRGQSDDDVGLNIYLHSQRFSGGLTNPRSDSGNSDYFATGNNFSQNTSGTAGWQERRRFVLSNGNSLWDVSGNVSEWMSDNRSALGIAAADDTNWLNTWGAYVSFLDGSNNSFTGVTNLIFGSLGNSGTQFSEVQNAGKIWPGNNCLARSGAWFEKSGAGLFTAGMCSGGPSDVGAHLGFRCSFLPPRLSPVVDSGAPQVSNVQRTTTLGTSVANNPVTVSHGGTWNLAWTFSDAENTGVNANKIRIQVRRKIAATNLDFPSISDAVYREGFQFTSLTGETAWVQGGNGQYTRNDNAYVNYLITAVDPSGNIGSATFSVQNIQSCPPGYVGVPGNSTAGLGSTNAVIGHSNKQLDPSYDFCVMKYPAKVMSAGTTAAQNYVGGLFEPIMNGISGFGADDSGGDAVGYSYTNSAQFDASIRYLPESRSSGTLWTNISRGDAISACRTQQMQYFSTMPDTTNGTGFQLISNTQWQVMARNAEVQNVNWSNNAVGSGVLNRGHSDNTISSAETLNSWCFGCTAPSDTLSSLPNSWTDTNPYFGTANSAVSAWNMLGTTPAAGSEQKRTHTLSNGNIVWDIAGNAWHWVSDDRNTLGISAADDAAGAGMTGWWKSYVEWGVNYYSSSFNLIFGGLGSGGIQFGGDKNAGLVLGGTGGALLRGGDITCSFLCGLFSVNLLPGGGSGPGGWYGIGYRCVYVPTPNTASLGGSAPQINALGRVNDMDASVGNNPVTIADGGSWNLKWQVSDAESTANNLTIVVRRKVTSTASDFPSSSDSTYASGTGATLTSLAHETAWQSETVTNNNTFVNYLITVTDQAGNSTSDRYSVQNTSSCPAGYVGVPGNSIAGLGNASASVGNANKWLDPSLAFCVMKYPAKNVSSVATSVAAGTPWVNISRDSAVTQCSNLGNKFRLISNTQWQVVARNAESVASNWSGGTVGVGVLNRGHSDGIPNNTLANSTSDTDAYFGTGNSSAAAWNTLGTNPAAGTEQKRTHSLSNGSVVWDFAGNVWQFISDDRGALGILPVDDTAGLATVAWTTFLNGSNNRFYAETNLIFGNAGSVGVQFSDVQNAGSVMGGTAGAVRRGGGWGEWTGSGLFGLRLDVGSAWTGVDSSFRCVWQP